MKTFILRNSTIDHLFLDRPDVVFSDYDSILFNENSYDRFIWFYTVPIKADIEKLVEEICDYKTRLELIINKLPKDKSLIVLTLYDIGNIRFEQSNWKLKETIYDVNKFIHNLAQDYLNIKVIEIDSFLNRFREKELIDWRYYFLSKAIINPKLATYFQNWFLKQLSGIDQKRKKCLIVDLDNTIWGGILGEDGLHGIQLNDNYPGNAFRQFQKGILELKNVGVILGICSKNNPKDVDEVWVNNDQMILKKEDFVSFKINWTDKATNISEIAQELNIGLDSMVFIDDNPSERELVKSILKDVSVPEFPNKPYKLIEFLNELYFEYFNTYKITDDDKRKTFQYTTNIARENAKVNYSSIESYIRDLEITLKVLHLNEGNISRFAQLTQKTNQFNLTTKRYIDSDLQKLALNGDWILGVKVEDKFGDSGISGIAIIKFIERNECVLDTFLLSCRILGKGIEAALISTILHRLKEKGIKVVHSSFRRTEKNQQVSEFYEMQNFKLVLDENGIKYYTFDLIKDNINVIKDYYKIL